jgi:hypothetical protein
MPGMIRSHSRTDPAPATPNPGGGIVLPAARSTKMAMAGVRTSGASHRYSASPLDSGKRPSLGGWDVSCVSGSHRLGDEGAGKGLGDGVGDGWVLGTRHGAREARREQRETRLAGRERGLCCRDTDSLRQRRSRVVYDGWA